MTLNAREEKILQLINLNLCMRSEDRHIIQTGVEIAKQSLDHVSKPITFLGSQNIIGDIKGPNVKYDLHYGPGY